MENTSGQFPAKIDNRPLYARAIDALNDLLSRGVYKPGTMLPKESVLAGQLGVSKSTLRVAMGHLEARGLISRRPGVGTFVALNPASICKCGFCVPMDRLVTIQKMGIQSGIEVKIVEKTIETTLATPECVQTIGAEEGELVTLCKIVKSVEGKVCAYLETYLLEKNVDLPALKNTTRDMVDYLVHHDQITPVRTQTSINSEPTPKTIADILGVREGDPILKLTEIFIDSSDKAVALSFNYFLTDRIGFSIIRRISA